MNDSMILHHYEGSPYSEKIRLMFGLTNTRWLSLSSPMRPPRPNLDPLTGGYRRIPVAQVGADIYCDTTLIASEVARIAQCPALDPATVDGSAAALMEKAEKEASFAALSAVSPLRVLGTLLKVLGPVEMFRLVKDRKTAFSDGTMRQPKGNKARIILYSFLDDLEARLTECPWVGGENPSVADFSSYIPLWCYEFYGRRPLETGPNVQQWHQRVGHFGHGISEEITQADAFEAAQISEPRPLPPSMEDVPVAIGEVVAVAPQNYCVTPTTGTLAAVTEDRVILAREHSELGKLHVHFPRAGYSLVAR